MPRSKLLQILATFDQQQLRSLDKFVSSSHFDDDKNINSQVVYQFFSYIRNNVLVSEEISLDKEEAFIHLYPEKQYVENKLHQVMSSLLKKVYRFIQLEELESKSVKRSLAIITYYRKNGLQSLFRSEIRKLKSEQRKIIRKDKHFYYNEYLIEDEELEFECQNNLKDSDLNLGDTLQSFNIYYVVTKLEYFTLLLSQGKHIKLGLDNVELLDELFKLIQQHNYLDIPLISIYYQIILVLQEPTSDSHFMRFKQLLDKHHAVLPINDLKAFQAHVRNYYLEKINKGETKYVNDVLHLYKKHLDQGTLYYDGKLHPSTIQNIVTYGLRLKEYDWVNKFLKTHQHKIMGTNYPENVYYFNLANVLFYQKKYDNALDHLSDKYEDIFYNISARRLRIKIYYEEKSDLLFSEIDSFAMYISRLGKRQIVQNVRDVNNRFVSFLRKLLNPKTFKNKDRIDQLCTMIMQSEGVAEKEWLLGKLEELR